MGVYAHDQLALSRDETWGGNLEPALMRQRTQAWLDSGRLDSRRPYPTQGFCVAALPALTHDAQPGSFRWPSRLSSTYAPGLGNTPGRSRAVSARFLPPLGRVLIG